MIFFPPDDLLVQKSSQTSQTHIYSTRILSKSNFIKIQLYAHGTEKLKIYFDTKRVIGDSVFIELLNTLFTSTSLLLSYDIDL